MSGRRTRTIGQIGNVAWGQATVAVVALVSIRIYTELLGPSHFGSAMLALGGIAFFDSLGVLALNQTLFSRCGSYLDHEARRLLAVGLSWQFFKAVATVVGGLALTTGLVASVASGSRGWVILPLLSVAYVAGETLKTSVLSLAVLDRRYVLYSSWLAAEAVVTVAGIVVCLTAWRTDVLGFVAGYCLSHLLCAVFFTAMTSPGHLRDARRPMSRDELRAATSYGVPVALMGPLGWVSSYLDRFILGATLGTAPTGVYVASASLIGRPFALTTSVLTSYFRPLYFQPVTAEHEADHYTSILRNWVLSALAIGITGVALAGLLGHWIAIAALAPDFRAGAHLLMVLVAVGQTFSIMTHAADNAVLAMRDSRRLLQTQAALTVVTLVLIPLGVMIGGVNGGVVGRAVAEAIKFTVVLMMATRIVLRRSPRLAQHTEECAS